MLFVVVAVLLLRCIALSLCSSGIYEQVETIAKCCTGPVSRNFQGW